MREVRAAWVGMGLLTAWVAWAASDQFVQPIPVVQELGPETRALEAQVGADPTDQAALVALGERYLSVGAVGLTQAALNRAPREVRVQPEVGDLQVRNLVGLGRADTARTAQAALLEHCEEASCPRAVVARGRRRLAWLDALARSGVQDPRADRRSAKQALRLASRTGSLVVQ